MARVLLPRDVVFFEIALTSPTAHHVLFGIVTEKSNGHLPLVYFIGMIVMSFAAFTAGCQWGIPSRVPLTLCLQNAIRPNLSLFAGRGMILDYILMPLLSIIYVGLTGFKLMPQVPDVVWVIVTIVGVTAINLRGVEMTARANLVLNCPVIASLLWCAVTAQAISRLRP